MENSQAQLWGQHASHLPDVWLLTDCSFIGLLVFVTFYTPKLKEQYLKEA